MFRRPRPGPCPLHARTLVSPTIHKFPRLAVVNHSRRLKIPKASGAEISSGPMATGRFDFDPPNTPPTPAIEGLDPGDQATSFRFTCDDYSRHESDPPVTTPQEDPPPGRLRLGTSPRSSPATFLHPHHTTSLCPPSPGSSSAMATEDSLAHGAPAAPAARNPFNFQTQVISTSPVKPVRVDKDLVQFQIAGVVSLGVLSARLCNISAETNSGGPLFRI